MKSYSCFVFYFIPIILVSYFIIRADFCYYFYSKGMRSMMEENYDVAYSNFCNAVLCDRFNSQAYSAQGCSVFFRDYKGPNNVTEILGGNHCLLGDEIINPLKYAISCGYNDALYNFNLGLAYMIVGDESIAENFFTEAIRLQGNQGIYYFGICLVGVARMDTQMVVEALSNAILVTPDLVYSNFVKDVISHYEISCGKLVEGILLMYDTLQLSKDRVIEDLAAYNMLYSLSETSDDKLFYDEIEFNENMNRPWIYRSLYEPDLTKALLYARRAVALDATDFLAHYQLSEVYLNLGKIKSSTREMQKAYYFSSNVRNGHGLSSKNIYGRFASGPNDLLLPELGTYRTLYLSKGENVIRTIR